MGNDQSGFTLVELLVIGLLFVPFVVGVAVAIHFIVKFW